MKKFKIPTGYLFVDEYSKGQLETLSIGDYGKKYNVKADFLQYTKDICGVPNRECMPLSEKWVMTLSTQYGCPMRCTFCDVPNIQFRGNASLQDLYNQLVSARLLFPSVNYTERLNIHYARMGDPIFNKNVFQFSRELATKKFEFQETLNLRFEVIHPVLTTSLPKKYKHLKERILDWCNIKNYLFNGQAGLQFSINSTNEDQRSEMFANQQLSLFDFSEIAKTMPWPLSRKYCLNFAYSTDFEIDAKKIDRLFNKEQFMVKITPIHNNNACQENKIKTNGGYDSWGPYNQPYNDLKELGWDVLVFVPSIDEEHGLVTCGNAILAGSNLKSQTNELKIQGIETSSIQRNT